MDSLNSPDLQEFLAREKQKAMVQETVAKITDVCWEKCITGTPGNKFSGSEANCLSQCAQRYMEVTLMVVNRFQQ